VVMIEPSTVWLDQSRMVKGGPALDELAYLFSGTWLGEGRVVYGFNYNRKGTVEGRSLDGPVIFPIRPGDR
jgi:hypothetical protein